MADDTDPTPPDAPTTEPEKKTFTYSTPGAWELVGAGVSFECAIAFAVEIGAQVTANVVGSRYRVVADKERLAKVAEWIAHFERSEHVAFGPERPPEKLKLKNYLIPRVAPIRRANIWGMNDAERLVVPAIDAGLTVVGVGTRRFEVSGTTAAFIAWHMRALEVTRARALEILGIPNEEAARAEDIGQPQPVEVKVDLPVREATSVIDRDARTGDIVRVTQTERTSRT